jgi:hypothetical protein
MHVRYQAALRPVNQRGRIIGHLTGNVKDKSAPGKFYITFINQ